MKKTLRIFTAMVVTVLMVMSLSITAFAADPTYTLTMKRAAGDRTAHNYDAYQVFKGKLTDTGYLTEITWGDGVNDADLLDALTDDGFAYHEDFDGCTTAADVAKVLDQKADESAFAKAFAAVVGANLSNTKAGTAAIAKNGSDSSTGAIPGLQAGYYFVKDDNSQADAENGNFTRFILKVIKDETITAKAQVPSLDKKIVEGEDEVEANSASIGAPIKFRIKTAVPDTTDYNKYYFIINDTLCKGLTFDADSLKVYIGGKTTPEESSAYTLTTTTNADKSTSFKLVLKNAKALSKLNKDCDKTTLGNENKANLTYSNDPNHTYVGDNEPSDNPNAGDVTGKTPEVKTKTYTTGVKIIKIDGETKERLAGAEFEIRGEKLNQVVVVTEEYSKDTDGTYYKLKDGSYTEAEPTEETREKYASETDKYKVTKSETLQTGTADNTADPTVYVATATVDDQGYLAFEGLGAGTYTIKETNAPADYNLLTTEFTVVIGATPAPTFNAPNWTVDGSAATLIDGTFVKQFEIENNKGVILPGTGGMGTTIFYVVGGLLIVCAGTLLVTKLRMSSKEK